ncbi:methylenetetrahydrofolate reductase [NAD(P)H] [Pectinatus sottacetonis]|uniref:methylenetetrahydrofolate reductase [NAD(P)H] n=1 Tax=Pectinatus sottacetonis TaxID=1002795 RepID=UPI0018C6F9B2|nr:methylenetetrahydrofolate reductase [NAD(P)H] [Pectinatus sottacetonis]
MHTNEVFKNKTVLSFEVFPPKDSLTVDAIDKIIVQLNELCPDFISVTCGANGNGGKNTVQIASLIKNKYKRESVAHLPGINITKDEVKQILYELQANNIENILALRGDRGEQAAYKTDFKYASDLVAFVKENSDFNIIGACYPEGHIEAKSKSADIKNLKYKVDAGINQLISQLFFDNNYFYSFIERAESMNINVPIEAGIMPVTSKKQIERMVTLCGATLPRKFQRVIARYESDPVALRDAGIAYAVDQIVDLLAHGVDGIHIYTMNNPYIAATISNSIRSLL